MSFDRRQFLAIGGAALTTALAGCGSKTRADESSPPQESSSDGPYASVYREAADSVVLIKTDQGQGTGFVFDDRHLVTNAHVVRSAETVDVQFADGTWRTGDVVGVDPHSDLAAVAVDGRPESATPLPLAEERATVGQEVIAIGNPFSLDGTATTGIVSGVDRSIPAPTGFRIPDAIQTDAAVNPGNSGGPLMTLSGRVLAVLNSGGGDNIAFGISAPLVRRVVPSLIESGEYRHPYLGAAVTQVTPDIAAANDLDDPTGVLVVGVASGGPADGVLRPARDVTVVDGSRVRTGGDVVTAVDGEDVATAEDLGSHLALNASPGDAVRCRILRDGGERTVDVELGARPDRPSDAV